MAAENEKQIWNLIGVIEAAAARILEAAEVPTVLLPRANAALPSSRLEVSFTPGEATNQHTLADGRKVYDYFEGGELRIRLATERPETRASLIPGVGDLHAEFLAAVLEAFDESRRPFDDLLPFHYVNTVRPGRHQRDLDSRFLEDFTELRFVVDVGVKETAWIQ